MSRECTICNHPKRKKIDEMLVEGISYGTIAKRFDISKQSLQRHKTKHLIPKIPPAEVELAIIGPNVQPLRAYPKINGFDIENLFHKMQVMVEKNFEIVEKFELLDADGNFIGTAADIKAKSAAIMSMKSTLEFISKMFGLISPDGVSPGYIQLKDRYEKMKLFILEEVCDDCRTKLIKQLEE